MVYTDFTKYSHAQLRTMAQALDPGAVMAAGDPWRKAATTLKEIRKTLTKASTEAATSWEGPTSNAFHTRMLNLAASINEAAAYANDAANTLHNMSEAMAKAKRDMPEEPGNWDKLKDTVGDVFSTDDEHVPIADRKKAEAAAVMQTLAMHYRIATPALKAPPLNGKPSARRDEPDSGSQNDPSGEAAVAAAVVAGTSFGTGGTSSRSTTVPPSQSRKSSVPPAGSGSASKNVVTDPGIKGGTAQAPPKSSTPAGRGPEPGISGTPVSRPAGTVPSPVTSGTQTSGLNTPPPAGPASGPAGGGGQTTATAPQPMLQAAPVGPGFEQDKAAGTAGKGPRGTALVESAGPHGRGETYPGIGAGGRAAPVAKEVAGKLARPGGAVPERTPPSSGARGAQAFTEGGTGLGARNRVAAESGIPGTGIMASGGPAPDAQRRRKDRGKSGQRPDFLVEDEETWASDKPSNPNVVE
ncbi:hypothetical protein ABT247_07375 [Kitasatospora sp. NPDC001539]|uniref:WXG100-like domain-containing protein n=1 Tax=Kitasatospora sp. NPDC001539 TaxID=3154384 RepID=UPI0033325B57